MAVERDQDFDAFYIATHRRIIGQIYAMTDSMQPPTEPPVPAPLDKRKSAAPQGSGS